MVFGATAPRPPALPVTYQGSKLEGPRGQTHLEVRAIRKLRHGVTDLCIYPENRVPVSAHDTRASLREFQ